jgi:WD40 repeat protein/serine/threonine protein kinase
MIQQEQSEKSIFLAAIEIGSVVERAAFLDQACSGNQPLRAKVEALLQAHEQPQRLLDNPPASTPTIDEMQFLERPGTVIGPYKLLEQIGEGGFGIVFMAEQQQPVRRKVALKVIKPGMDTKQVVARFEAERHALALMDHPHIAHVLDAGTTDAGRPYFAMELIRGIPITQFCDDNRLTPRERLELFLSVCQAVQHAHQKGIIHRDLKPSNMLVTLLDGTPAVKVIDFGIAKALGQVRLTDKTLFTDFAHMIGTPLYMSPEQAEMSGQDVDTRTDIYALGVLLYELLTGTTPFDKERLKEASYDEVRRIIREEEPVKPSTRISTLGQAATTVSANRKSEPKRLSQLFRGELDWIVMKALEKDRDRRYDTASSFAADVQRYLDDEPVEACPPSAGYRLRKFVRRYRMPVFVAAGFAVLLVAGVVVSTWQALRATVAERVASTAEANARQEAKRARRQWYSATMGLVQAAWENHNILRFHELLAETTAFPERGFEWYYWQRLCRREHLALLGHRGSVTAVAFAPGGQRLVTGGMDGTARVWDATSGRELLCLRGHRSRATAVAFAPDGQWLVTGGTDGTARVWDPSTGRELQRLRIQKAGAVWAVAVTPDGKRVLTGSEDGTARVWDVASGQELLALQGQTAVPSLGASMVGLLRSPQGQGPFLAASALYLGRTGHTGPVLAVAAAPDGRTLVTGNGDHTARVWDAHSGRELLPPLEHTDDVHCVLVSTNGQWLGTGTWELSPVTLWDRATGRKLLSLSDSSGLIRCVTLTPDGKRLVTGSGDGTAKVWDTARGAEIMTLVGHKDGVTCVAVSPDGKRVVTGSGDGTARLWDTVSGRGTLRLKGHNGPVRSLAATPDGRRVVTGGEDGTVRLWDAVSGRGSLPLKGHTYRVTSVAITPDGQRIVTGGVDGTARVWNAVSGRQLFKIDNARTGRVCSVAVTPDGQRIFTGGEDGMARLWDADGGRILFTLNAHMGRVKAVSITPDGERLVTGGWDGEVKLWDARTGDELLKFKASSEPVLSVAVMPDNEGIVTGSMDGTAAVWETARGRKLLSLEGHTGPVWSVAASADRRRIATGGVDCTARLWDAVSGRELLTLKGHTGPVNCVALSPDGRRLITGSEDGTVKIWDAASPEELALWVRQDQEDVQRLAEAAPRLTAWLRPVASAPGFIQDWLVLAPLTLEHDESGAEALERQQLPGEASLQPRAGDSVLVQGRKRTWKAHRGERPIIDFNRLVGNLCIQSVAYAVCYVISEAERTDLLLQVGSDDQAKVYLNGQEIYKHARARALTALDPIGPIRLRKGTNVLVLKVMNEFAAWEACARFVDSEDNPAKGLRVRLTRE